ncbi:helix-turn-helix domain-containing protein [Microbacterium halophytorum]|uniref:helix-turn-helix domain-containing protein n=1 Tax=Microbacterium halophytorum TaxID=2067568 RepID=UPI0018E0A74A
MAALEIARRVDRRAGSGPVPALSPGRPPGRAIPPGRGDNERALTCGSGAESATAVPFTTLDAICRELGCRPGDVLAYESSVTRRS